MKNPKFIIKRTRGGKFYFNLTASNGQVIATSEMYATKRSAHKGINSIKRVAVEAGVEEAI